MKPLKFRLGEETHVVIEDNSQRNDSLFSSQYDYAFNEIGRILPACCDREIKEDNDEKDVKYPGNQSELTINNVFAFIGDRGTGKSSCMLSAACMLREGHVKFMSREGHDDFIDKKCHILDVLDPSFFDDNANILDIVIGKLFLDFKKQLKKRPNIDNDGPFHNKKSRLYESFQKVQDCLVNISHKNDSEEDSVEYLGNLSSSVDLQNAMQKLINRYLIFNNQDLLVIPVDDIDLHTRCAYKMVEQVRKYLVQKNVIVLMAVKIEQLKQVIENEYASQYSISLKDKWVAREAINDMADRYLVKFIPQSHRIFMPDMKVYMDTEIQLLKDGSQVWPRNDEEHISLKYAVTKLIFRKTRYLFYHRKGIASPIVPHNLREVRHLISFLYSMPGYWDNNGKERKENQTAFKHYIFETWLQNNLDSQGADSIRRLESLRDVSIFNKTVLFELKERFNGLLGTTDSPKWLSAVYDDRSAAYNISIGDVFSVIDYIKKRVTKSYDSLYVFALETLYSMRMYEYYNIMTESEEKNSVSGVDETIKQRSMFDDIQLYHVLAGGSFLYSTSRDYLARSKNGVSRDRCKVKLSTIVGWINDFKENRDICSLWAAEWMCLFIARRNYESSTNYRRAAAVVYNEKFYKVDNIIFDITSLFYNITDIKNAYDRVSNELFDIASSSEHDSLYRTLLNSASHRHNGYSHEHNLLSWGCIRNAEILEDFSDALSTNVYSRSSNIMDHYLHFLDKVGKYYIKTYDRDDDNTPYDIKYAYASILLEVMKNPEVKRKLESALCNQEETETSSLTADNINAILNKIINNKKFIEKEKLSSSRIIHIVTTTARNFNMAILYNLFERYKAYPLEEIESKLDSLKG